MTKLDVPVLLPLQAMTDLLPKMCRLLEQCDAAYWPLKGPKLKGTDLPRLTQAHGLTHGVCHTIV